MAPRTKAQQTEYDALVKEYRKMARKADASLRATESYQYDKNFKIMIKWSYAKAQKEIKRFGGNKRFDTAPPKNINTLKAKMNAIQDYLDSPTRTKQSVRQIFVDKATEINSLYGTNFTWSQVGDFFESEAWVKIDDKYGSKTAVRVIGSLKKKGVDIVKKVTDASKKHEKLDDEFVEKEVFENVKRLGINIDDLY